MAPVSVSCAIPFSNEMFTSSSELRFQWAVAFFIPYCAKVALLDLRPVSNITEFLVRQFWVGKVKPLLTRRDDFRFNNVLISHKFCSKVRAL
jgi:hypothetical protein